MNKILTLKEVQEILKLSRSKTYELAKNGVLPVFKIDKSYRVLENDLYTWISNQIKPISF